MPQSAAPMALIGALTYVRSHLLPTSRKKVNGIKRLAGSALDAAFWSRRFSQWLYLCFPWERRRPAGKVFCQTMM